MKTCKKYICFVLVAVGLAAGAHPVFAADLNRKEEDAFYVASRSFQDGFYDVALTLFERYLKTYPDSDRRLEALLYIGECYFFEEKYLKALDQFDALSRAPGVENIRDKVLFWLGEVYAKGRDYKQAVQYYKDLIDHYKDSSYLLSAYRSLGQAYLAMGLYKPAADTYRQVLATFTDAAVVEEATFGVCEALYRLADYDALKSELMRFISRYPQSRSLDRAYFYMAEADFYLGQYREAIASYQSCLQKNPGEELKDLSTIGLGWSYLKLQDFDKAASNFAVFGEEDAPLPVVLGRAQLNLEQGAFAQALSLFDGVILSDKAQTYGPLAYFGKGEALYNLNRFEEATVAYRVSLDKLKELLGTRPENRELRDKICYGLAWSYLKLGDFRAAQEVFQKVATLTSDKVFKLSALCQLADTYQDAGEYDRAIEAYRKFLEDYPDSVYSDYIQYQVGVTWLKSKNEEAAILAFRKLLKDFPNSKLVDDAAYFLGVTYFQKGDFGSAAGQFQEFIASYRTSAYRPQALFLLGEALFNLGRYKESIDIFVSVVKEYPQEAAVRQKAEYEIANTYAQSGDRPEAEKRFADFITRYPDSPLTPNILFWLGQSAFERKDYAAARKHLERLIRNYPGHESVSEAYMVLGSGSLAEDQPEAAMRLFRQARQSGSSAAQAKALAAMGNLARDQGHDDEAMGYYREAAASDASWAKTADVRQADILRKKKSWGEASALLERALLIEGPENNAGIQWRLAEIQEEGGHLQEAVDAYMKFYYMYPGEKDTVKALLRVAKIYEQQQERPALKNILEKIVALNVAESKYAAEKLADLR